LVDKGSGGLPGYQRRVSAERTGISPQQSGEASVSCPQTLGGRKRSRNARPSWKNEPGTTTFGIARRAGKTAAVPRRELLKGCGNHEKAGPRDFSRGGGQGRGIGGAQKYYQRQMVTAKGMSLRTAIREGTGKEGHLERTLYN